MTPPRPLNMFYWLQVSDYFCVIEPIKPLPPLVLISGGKNKNDQHLATEDE